MNTSVSSQRARRGLLMMAAKVTSWATISSPTIRARIFKLIRSPRIDSNEPIPPGCVEGARNRIWIGVVLPTCQTTQPGGIGSWESILGLLKSSKIQALASRYDNPVPTRFLAPTDCLKIPSLESITYSTVLGNFFATSPFQAFSVFCVPSQIPILYKRN